MFQNQRGKSQFTKKKKKKAGFCSEAPNMFGLFLSFFFFLSFKLVSC